ncbi:MAG: methyltransferase domain-containing protein [Burkholderiaceae bacterium]|nr:methyltransferase domain-containing protein [Burkholderiaceae bacterium]
MNVKTNMPSPWLTNILRCPQTRQPLERGRHGWQRCSDGKEYPDQDGISSLVWPQELTGSDKTMNQRYAWLAPFYDLSERWLGHILTGLDMPHARRELVNRLPLQPGMRLLEVSPGPGIFQPFLRSRLGENAQIAAVDLSMHMLKQCQRRYIAEHVELVHANAQYLPFADDAFDALFHFGGINLFNDPDRALQEFVRVVRTGGLIAWGDEQMSETFRHPLGRYVLPRLNPGYKIVPPDPPAGMRVSTRHIVYDGLGSLVVGTKSIPST